MGKAESRSGQTGVQAEGFGLADVNSHLLAIGRRQLELERLRGEMNLEIDDVKKRYQTRLQRLRQEVLTGEVGLAADVKLARKSLFKRAAKSLRTLFGKVGFRAIPGSVSLAKGTSEDEAVRLLQARGLDHLVRKRLEVNKAAVQSGLAAGEVDEQQLHRCGLAFKSPGEKFFYDLDRAEIEKQP